MKLKFCTSVCLAALLSFAFPALAVDELGLFELDGNADYNGTADDWENLYNPPPLGSYYEFTGIEADPAPESIFTGGRKDIQDIDQWGQKDGSVPDKDEITNAYAAAYTAGNGDQIVYFGLDRITNNGDAFVGFWFFKNEITLTNGGFDGLHAEGDVLVLANFPQAAGAVPQILVIQWEPLCTKAAKDPVPSTEGGEPGVNGNNSCWATNLELVYGGEGAGAVCATDGVNPDACAITNLATVDAPWPYTFKDGTTGEFPFETFFEGGINLTSLFPDSDGCFASFMAESRSSSEFTASLKDFVLDAFPLCSIDVTKTCTSPRLNAAEDMIIYDIEGSIINDGSGTIYNVGVTDNPAFDAGTLSYDASTDSVPGGCSAAEILAGGCSVGYSATITVALSQNGPMDTVTATGNTRADNFGSSLTDTATAQCPDLQVNPAATVSKSCSSIVSLLDSPVVVIAQVTYTGEVCNTGDSRLDNVVVTETPMGGTPTTETFNLGSLAGDPDGSGAEVGECKTYSGTYTPNQKYDIGMNVYTGNDPTAVWFHDSVEVTADDIFGDPLPTPLPTASASCPLCECEEPECP
jgi:hypothetical protein